MSDFVFLWADIAQFNSHWQYVMSCIFVGQAVYGLSTYKNKDG